MSDREVPSDEQNLLDEAEPLQASEAAEGDDDLGPALSEDLVTDSLPEDLDVSGYVGPYVFPNNNRRRTPGLIYLICAAICLAGWLSGRGAEHGLINEGLLWAAVALGVAGAFCFWSGFNLDIDEQDALIAASKKVNFAIGHASAQMGWRGFRSRPTWRILCYSSENPPKQRALVLVDGVDASIVDHFVEANPEDWSDLDGQLTGQGKPFKTGE